MTILKVGIDVSGMVSNKKATGLTRYLKELVVNVAAQCDQDAVELHLYFANKHFFEARHADILSLGLQNYPNVYFHVAPITRGWYRLGLGLSMLVDRLDVFHFPVPRLSSFCPVPSVVTVFDIAAMSIDAALTQQERRYLPDMLKAIRRASALIAISENTNAEIKTHVNRHDATVIRAGVNLEQFCPASEPAVQALKNKYGINRYILSVGTLQARKNHLGLIKAFGQIQDQVPHTLVLAGRAGSGAEAVHAYIASHPALRVQFIGYLDEAELPALYTGADALALPSFWEGFGLPIPEAMACGTPVLTSNLSALAEIAGDAALLVDPHDTEALAQALLTLLTDSALKQRLVEAGFRRSRNFSWQQLAIQTLQVYKNVPTASS